MEFTQSAEIERRAPQSVHTGWDLFYSLSIEPAGTKWMVARKGRAQFRPNFGPNFRTKTIFEPKRREIPKTYDDVVATLTEEPPYLILPQAGS